MVAVQPEKRKHLPTKNLRRITAYLPPDLYEKLEAHAQGDRRTISQMAVILLEEAIANRDGKRGDQ